MTNTSTNSIQAHQSTEKKHSIDGLAIIFLLLVLWYIPKGIEADTLTSLGIVFVSIVLEAIPFMLVGALVGGMIEVFINKEHMTALLPKRQWLSVFIAAGAGLFFPVCECAVVPVVRRLMGKGLPLSAAVAYLLGGPIVNPIVAASTAMAYAFEWPIMLLRLAIGYAIAVTIGLMMGVLFRSTPAVKENNHRVNRISPFCDCCHQDVKSAIINISDLQSAERSVMEHTTCGCDHLPHSKKDKWIVKIGAAFQHAVDDFLAVGHYLVIGAFIAALAQTHVERSSFLNIVQEPITSIGLMMGLAILLNLCSEADAFIAASLRGLMPLSGQMAFMLTGPMFDLKLLLMYQNVFKKKAIFYLAGLIIVVIMGASIGFNWLNGLLE
ncbi:MAG: permease [Desulfobacteraceae bacterium]